MIGSFRAFKTDKASTDGVGWCLHIIHENLHIPTRRFWFKDLTSLFSFMLAYPEGQDGKEI